MGGVQADGTPGHRLPTAVALTSRITTKRPEHVRNLADIELVRTRRCQDYDLSSNVRETCFAACASCNHRKGRVLEMLGWSARSTPLPAKNQDWLPTVNEIDPACARYLGEGPGPDLSGAHQGHVVPYPPDADVLDGFQPLSVYGW